jgi:hypothetical protein
LDKDGDLAHAKPECFDARFAIMLASKESTESSDQTDHCVEPRHLLGRYLTIEDVSGLPLLSLEQQVRRQIGQLAPQSLTR